jgi:phage-related protein
LIAANGERPVSVVKTLSHTFRGSEIGQSLFEAQLGEHPHNAKPLKGFSGVSEIRDNFDGDTYRTIYTTRLEGVLYVLHAFQKKSTSGIATPQRHIDLIRQRQRDAGLSTTQQRETDDEHEEEAARP